jgi:L-fucose isomerase-like protein
MLFARAQALEYPIQDVVGVGPNWPHAFVRLDVPPKTLIESLQANHVHLVAGDYRAELAKLCRMLNVEPLLLGE